MMNFESGESLIKDAESYCEEMQHMFEKGKWNIVIKKGARSCRAFFKRNFEKNGD